jgi:hypothetical protein
MKARVRSPHCGIDQKRGRGLAVRTVGSIVKRLGEPEYRDAIEFLHASGFRAAEAVSLRWRDINMSEGSVVVHGMHGGRRVQLADVAMRVIRGRLRDARGPDSPVFCRPDGRAISRAALARAFGQARRRAGIVGCRLHDLRKESIRRLVCGGGGAGAQGLCQQPGVVRQRRKSTAKARVQVPCVMVQQLTRLQQQYQEQSGRTISPERLFELALTAILQESVGSQVRRALSSRRPRKSKTSQRKGGSRGK